MNPSSPEDGALQSLIRLVRRVCLLSEQGEEAEAVRIESTQLAEAVRQFRHDHGPDALTEQHLAEIFVNEQRRAADAVVLAELLIPQLTGRVDSRQARTVPAGHRALADRSARDEGIVPTPGSNPPQKSPASIPDFLDAMLAGDSSKNRVRLFPQSTTTQ